jgi:O-antigen ligase
VTIPTRILIGLLAWGVLSFGAVYPWGYWPLAAGCLVVGIWLVVLTRAWRERRPRQLAWSLGAVSAAIALQLVPLPYDWFRAISPSSDALLSQLRIGWAVRAPGFHVLSIAPGGTLTALALLAAFSVLVIGLMRGVAYMPLGWMVEQLTVLGLAIALFAIVQRVESGPGDILVYGLWRAKGLARPFGPFINHNHFAGWMLLVLPLALAAAMARAQATREPFQQGWRDWFKSLAKPDANRFLFTASAILIMAVALVLSGSRTGLASVIVVIGALGYFASWRGTDGLKRFLPAFCLLLFVIVAFAWVGVDDTAARPDGAPGEFGERVTPWRDTVHIARDFPIAGTGFGGYGLAMLVYQTAGRHSIYAQAHNDYLQILAEGGLLVAVPVAVALIVVVVNIRHRFRLPDPPATYWLRAGATAGLLGIAAQSALDFSLQMPGNAMMFAVLLAIALHRPSSQHANRV